MADNIFIRTALGVAFIAFLALCAWSWGWFDCPWSWIRPLAC